MLCRTANELFWMARHIERAENTARLLDVTYRTSLLPYHIQEPGLAWAEPWSVPLISTGVATPYYKHYPELAAESVLKFMIMDEENPSSIYCCLRAARSRRHHLRNVRGSQQRMDRDPRKRPRAPALAGCLGVPRLGQDAVAPV